MKSTKRQLLAALAICLASTGLSFGDQPSGWLNARDCGASGSNFQTTATTQAGSNKITVADVGDFKAGQGVMVSKCNIHFPESQPFTNAGCNQPYANTLWGPREKGGAHRSLNGEVELRGYDGTAGSWVVYILDVAPGSPCKFRWTDDLGRNWKPAVPITYDWQPLSGGVEVRFQKFEWEKGYTAAIVGRDQLISTIERIDGNVLTLRDAANRTVSDAMVRHNDTAALQAAVDRAVAEKKNLYVPIGHYQLAGRIIVKDASAITIQGQNAVDTVLDLSEGIGSCLALQGGAEVTIRNFTMLGHMGFDQRDQAGIMRTQGGSHLWGFYLKLCNAVYIAGTERVLVENCHARRMSMEAFYSAGPGRAGTWEPKAYTKAITYLRCSVEDCARNAFNNNDTAENTSILYCRIRDVGGCSWEGASRFVRFIGNYVRNAGAVAMGNMGSRSAHLEELGTGQHIVAHNVFESGCPYGLFMVAACDGATQVIVRDNLFVNFNSSAVGITGHSDKRHLPAENAIIAGNIFDMTAVGDKPKARTAVHISTSGVIVGDNQIYVRGECDPLLTGIQLRDSALNLNVHDNLLQNCGAAIAAGRVQGRLVKVVDNVTFLFDPTGYLSTAPHPRRKSHCYRGWNVAWIKGDKPDGISVIDHFDPETCQVTLRGPREMKAGDLFEVFPPNGANWNIHDNTITGCLQPVVLDGYGSTTSVLTNNLISRGETAGVKEAVVIRGRFNVLENQFFGFDEPDSATLSLYPDRLGASPANLYRGNVFERCANVVSESGQAYWDAAHSANNMFLSCGRAPAQKP